MSRNQNSEEVVKEREEDVLVPLVAFSILAFVIMLAAANIESPGILSYTLFTFAFLVSTWVCLVAIEKSAFTKWFWSFKTSSVIIGLLVSAFIFYASMRSSALLNEVFLADSSALVYTKVIAYVLYSFSLFMPFFLAYLGLAFIVLIKTMVKPSDDESNTGWMKIIIFFVNGMILGLIGGPTSSLFWNEDTYKEKIEEVADFADFGIHNCININRDLKVIFLGSAQREVLVKHVEQELTSEDRVSYIRAECIPDTANKKIQPTKKTRG